MKTKSLSFVAFMSKSKLFEHHQKFMISEVLKAHNKGGAKKWNISGTPNETFGGMSK